MFELIGIGSHGQGTVEAALIIPAICLGVLLLMQPAIVLYDRMVMVNAASETCRVLTTLPSGEVQAEGEHFALRRLASIPQVECFHAHEAGCSYKVTCSGGASGDAIRVRIENRLKPLPLIGAGAGFLGLLDSEGFLGVDVSVQMPVQPGWVASSPFGSDPSRWIGAWFS